MITTKHQSQSAETVALFAPLTRASRPPHGTNTSLQDTIITVLPSGAIVNAIFDKILAGSLPERPSAHRSGRLYIDCSTISPLESRALAKRITEQKAGTFLDAPMSGGTVGAAAGTLTFMLGAPSPLVPRVSSILKHMGKRVVHLGNQGSGLCGKLANNYLLALNNIATAEAMNLGMKLGLDPKTLAGMINSSTGKCWPSEVNNPVPGVIVTAPASRDYAGGFGVSLMKKDLGLAIDAADAIGIDMSKGLGQKCKEIYDACEQDEKCKGKDFSVVYRWLGGKE